MKVNREYGTKGHRGCHPMVNITIRVESEREPVVRGMPEFRKKAIGQNRYVSPVMRILHSTIGAITCDVRCYRGKSGPKNRMMKW